MLLTLPNQLSLFRIVLIPLLVYFLSDSGPVSSALAALVFFVASLTDFLDGYFARLHGHTSTLGKLLDPLADKLLVAAALIMLVAANRAPRVPAWMVVVIIGRELAVTGLRSIASGEGIILAAEKLGKAKMLFQIFALHCLIIHYSYFFIDFHTWGIYLLWIALVLGVWSGVEYYVKVLRRLMAKHADQNHVPLSSDRIEARG